MLPLLLADVAGLSAPAASVDLPAARDYRSGVVVGLSGGAGLGGASGYPNNSQQIGDPRYYSASGWMAGEHASVFVMGAFSDYLSFGFWYGHTTLQSPDWRSSADGVGFRLEVFPLVGVVPRLHGLGVLANVGLGSGSLTATTPGLPSAGGTQSFGGIGLFHEWAFGHVLGGHFALGPAVELDATWSQPFEQHIVAASLRATFYGGP